jgi:hypothetical protein
VTNRVHRRLAAALVALALFVPGTGGGQISVVQLKAQVIERLTQFIEWPAPDLPANSRFIVCLHGASATADELARVASRRPFKERTCEVRRVQKVTEFGACHLLFISGVEADRLPQILAATGGKPILTVSDQDGFAERGVLVNLFMEGRYVRFQVNLAAVDRSHLFFSSKLLRLARLIGT